MTSKQRTQGRPVRAISGAVKSDILAAARIEFEQYGLSGARVDAIAARAQTNKRMIYYYFSNKQDLYLAVLESAYNGVREVETRLSLDDVAPPEAIRRLVAFTVHHHNSNPGFVRLLAVENIHNAFYLKRSTNLQRYNAPIISLLERIINRGLVQGVFQRQLDPRDVHWMISALCFYRVSNKATFSTLFDFNFEDSIDRHSGLIGDAVVGLLMTTSEQDPNA